MTHLERLFAALYISEGWYALWAVEPETTPLFYKIRALVLYDRVLNGRYDPIVPPLVDK